MILWNALLSFACARAAPRLHETLLVVHDHHNSTSWHMLYHQTAPWGFCLCTGGKLRAKTAKIGPNGVTCASPLSVSIPPPLRILSYLGNSSYGSRKPTRKRDAGGQPGHMRGYAKVGNNRLVEKVVKLKAHLVLLHVLAHWEVAREAWEPTSDRCDPWQPSPPGTTRAGPTTAPRQLHRTPQGFASQQQYFASHGRYTGWEAG